MFILCVRAWSDANSAYERDRLSRWRRIARASYFLFTRSELPRARGRSKNPQAICIISFPFKTGEENDVEVSERASGMSTSVKEKKKIENGRGRFILNVNVM